MDVSRPADSVRRGKSFRPQDIRGHRKYASGSDCRPDACSGVTASIGYGWALLEYRLPDGRRQVLQVLGHGDIVGADLFVGLDQAYGLVALTDLCLEVLPSDWADHHGLELLSAFNQRLCRHAVRLGRLSAPERLADFLLEQAERCDPTANGTAAFELPLSQGVLADVLGLSTVHINRCLQDLRQRQLVSFRSGWLTIHSLRGLRLAAGGAGLLDH